MRLLLALLNVEGSKGDEDKGNIMFSGSGSGSRSGEKGFGLEVLKMVPTMIVCWDLFGMLIDRSESIVDKDDIEVGEEEGDGEEQGERDGDAGDSLIKDQVMITDTEMDETQNDERELKRPESTTNESITNILPE